ncbi:MAG: DNA polymerase III subunit delta [Proteobacteria bacterium]|nr:DNA polymerase III subunit delta [Pseudomonadota bacterium]
MTAIYANQLAQKLNPLPLLVLLWGEDAGAIRQAAQTVIAATGVDMADPFAAEKLTLNDLATNPSRLADSAQTLSFTSPHRLISFSGISGDESAATVTALTDAVKTTLSLPLSAVTIVLPVPKLLEKSSALVKAAEAHPQALSVRFFADAARDLTPFLKNEIEAAGQRIEPSALQLLTASLGADRDIARREVEKLLLYAGTEDPITEAHVLESVAGAIPADAFRLAEAVGARNTAQTDKLLQHLLQQGEDLSAAFTLALRHLTTLKTAQALKAEGKSESEILLQTGKSRAPKPAQADFLRQINHYPAARLAGLADYAVETLTTARSGLLEGNFVLQRALLALSA